MTKTFIIVVILLAVLAYIWWSQSSNISSESFTAVNNMNTKDCYQQNTNSNKIAVNDINNTIYDQITNSDNNNDTQYTTESEITDIREDDNELIINDSVVTYDDNTGESNDQIKKKFITRNHPCKSGYKHDNYCQGDRGGMYSQAINFIDESNDLMQSAYSTNDQFTGNDELKGQYAPYKPEKRKTNKYKASEIFNSQNYLPNEKSANPNWFDVVPDAISVKNRHLINVSKPIGINTIGTSLRNPSYDIRGSPPNPKFVISPWLQSTIEPDNNFKSLCA